jgi:hypothetical protein
MRSANSAGCVLKPESLSGDSPSRSLFATPKTAGGTTVSTMISSDWAKVPNPWACSGFCGSIISTRAEMK